MCKVSIIVPVYNVENFLRECLDSLVNQDLDKREYEIICINDGSPDNSQQILEEYAKIYSNIVVVVQENKGVTATRNKGISLAKGEYIWFVDSDDYICYNCLNSLYQVAHLQNLDQLFFNFGNFYQNGDKKYFAGGTIDELIEQSTEDFTRQGDYVFCSLIKRKLLVDNDIKFVENVFVFEEKAFNFQIDQVAKSKKKINCEVYYYRVFREGSATSTYKNRTKEYIQSRINLAEWYNLSLKKYKNNPSAIKELKTRKKFDLQGLLSQTVSLGDKAYTKSIIKTLKEKGLYPYNTFSNLIPEKSFKKTIKNLICFLYPIKLYLYLLTFIFKLKNKKNNKI